jgi:hypothetical protein
MGIAEGCDTPAVLRRSVKDLDWKRVVKHSGGEKGQKSVGKIQAAPLPMVFVRM